MKQEKQQTIPLTIRIFADDYHKAIILADALGLESPQALFRSWISEGVAKAQAPGRAGNPFADLLEEIASTQQAVARQAGNLADLVLRAARSVEAGAEHDLQELLDLMRGGQRNEESQEDAGEYFILNTNRANNPEAESEMLNRKMAAAFYPPHTTGFMARVHRGDRIFLYSSGRGVVAMGSAAGAPRLSHVDGDPESEKNMASVTLDPYFQLKRPVRADELRAEAGFPVVLRRTLALMPAAAGRRLWDHLMGEI